MSEAFLDRNCITDFDSYGYAYSTVTYSSPINLSITSYSQTIEGPKTVVLSMKIPKVYAPYPSIDSTVFDGVISGFILYIPSSSTWDSRFTISYKISDRKPVSDIAGSHFIIDTRRGYGGLHLTYDNLIAWSLYYEYSSLYGEYGPYLVWYNRNVHPGVSGTAIQILGYIIRYPTYRVK